MSYTTPEDAMLKSETSRKRFYGAAAVIAVLSVGTVILYSVLQMATL